MVGKHYEGSGATLEAALKEIPGRYKLNHLDALQFRVEIFRKGKEGKLVADVTSGRPYDHVLSLANSIADQNTRGMYLSEPSRYRRVVTVRGWYQ